MGTKYNSAGNHERRYAVVVMGWGSILLEKKLSKSSYTWGTTIAVSYPGTYSTSSYRLFGEEE